MGLSRIHLHREHIRFETCNVIFHPGDMKWFRHDAVECARNGFRNCAEHLKIPHFSLIACGSVEARKLGTSIVKVGLAFRPIGFVHAGTDPLRGEDLPSIHD